MIDQPGEGDVEQPGLVDPRLTLLRECQLIDAGTAPVARMSRPNRRCQAFPDRSRAETDRRSKRSPAPGQNHVGNPWCQPASHRCSPNIAHRTSPLPTNLGHPAPSFRSSKVEAWSCRDSEAITRFPKSRRRGSTVGFPAEGGWRQSVKRCPGRFEPLPRKPWRRLTLLHSHPDNAAPSVRLLAATRLFSMGMDSLHCKEPVPNLENDLACVGRNSDRGRCSVSRRL